MLPLDVAPVSELLLVLSHFVFTIEKLHSVGLNPRGQLSVSSGFAQMERPEAANMQLHDRITTTVWRCAADILNTDENSSSQLKLK